MKIHCENCLQAFEHEDFKGHACPPPAPIDPPAEAPHDVPGFGALGQSPEAAEAHRISALSRAGDLPAIPTKAPQEFEALDQGRHMAILMKPVMAEARRELTALVDELRSDIADSNRLLKHLDVPLEEVHNSHERAASSFENLRAEIRRVSDRLGEVENVIDTAGLTRAVSTAEERMRSLAEAIKVQFTQNSQNMVEILRLLQKLQDRDLSETRKRINRAARRAVGKVRA
jgi:methyl-accepting chemotaxis protein